MLLDIAYLETSAFTEFSRWGLAGADQSGRGAPRTGHWHSLRAWGCTMSGTARVHALLL